MPSSTLRLVIIRTLVNTCISSSFPYDNGIDNSIIIIHVDGLNAYNILFYFFFAVTFLCFLII